MMMRLQRMSQGVTPLSRPMRCGYQRQNPEKLLSLWASVEMVDRLETFSLVWSSKSRTDLVFLAARQQKVGRREFNNRLNRDRTFAKCHAYNGSHVSFWAENMHGYSQIGSHFSHYAVGNKQNMLLFIPCFSNKKKRKEKTHRSPSW